MLGLKFKRILSMILAVLVFTSLLPVALLCASADSSAYEVEEWITTKAGLHNIRNNLSGKYGLDCNIEFSPADFAEGGAFHNGGKGWEPIGSDIDHPFTGLLYGGGFTISGICINISGASDVPANAGLFGVNSGKIERVVLKNATVTVDSTLVTAVGGLVGNNRANGKIISCYSNGIVSAVFRNTAASSLWAGGIAGCSSGTIEKCDNEGTVLVSSTAPGEGIYAGGIVGEIFGKTVTESRNTGTVSLTSTRSGQGDSRPAGAGGIAGKSSNSGVVESCYNAGEISASSTYNSYAGGIIGDNGVAKIKNCYNTATVFASGASAYTGGITGRNAASGEINNTYNAGIVSVSASSSNAFSGGITGDNSGMAVNCYYLDNISKGTGKSPDIGVKLTSAQMKIKMSYVGFDFDAVWDITGRTDYEFPTLRSLYDYEETAENMTDFSGGNGKPYNPYRIKTKNDLDNMRKYTGASFVLENNIDFSLSDFEETGGFYNGGEGWMPVGENDTNAFSGSFDGGGYKISGILVNAKVSRKYSGLIGYNAGTVKNLELSGVVTSAGTHAGGFAGYNNGIITGCINNSAVSASAHAGGIAGFGMNGKIENCRNTGAISATATAGGITGNNCGEIVNCYNIGRVSGNTAGGITGENSGTITSSHNTGTVSGNSQSSTCIGGIAGKITSGQITKSYNTGDILSESNTSVRAGGVVGEKSGASTISECYNSGKVSVSVAMYIGGIAGETGGTGSIGNCYNDGTVSSITSVSDAAAGGISGYNYSSNIENCYNAGALPNSTGSFSVGGILGENAASGTIVNCYYLNTASRETGKGGGTERQEAKCTDAAMRLSDTFRNFNFDTIWIEASGQYKYPQLRNCTYVLPNKIEITKLPDKLEYEQGEAFDEKGMEITAYYDDGTKKIVPFNEKDSFSLAGYNHVTKVLEESGEKTVTVGYKGFQDTFTVKVNPKRVVRIELDTVNSLQKFEFTEETKINLYDIKLIVYYSYGDERKNTMPRSLTVDIDTPFTIIPFTVLGEQYVTAHYYDTAYPDDIKSVNVPVNVIPKTIDRIEVDTANSITECFQGQTVSQSDVKIKVFYNNGTSADNITPDSIIGDTTEFGTGKILTAEYRGARADFTIDVIEKVVTSITVDDSQNKTRLIYFLGEQIKLEEIIIIAYYNDGTEALTNPDEIVSGNTSTGGDNVITVSYKGKTDSYTIHVNVAVLQQIRIINPPTKRSYVENDMINTSGMVVMADYKYDSGEEFSSEINTTLTIIYDFGTVGTKTVTVRYISGGVTKEDTFTVTVTSRVPANITSGTYTISGGFASGLLPGITAASFLSKLNESAFIKLYNGNSEISGSTKIGTGMTARLMDGNTVKQSVTVVVKGDLTGTGETSALGLLKLKRHILNIETLKGAWLQAANVDGNASVDALDLLKLKRDILGLERLK